MSYDPTPPPQPPPYQQPYQQQPPPYQQQPYQQNIQIQKPGTDKSKSFLNMSTGVLVGVIALILVVCCIGPIALCFLGGIFEAAQPKPDVQITSCRIDNGGFLKTAEISYQITNNRSSEASYLVEFVVKDSGGNQVGSGSDWASGLAGDTTASLSTTIFLDATGGKTCAIVEVS